MAEGKIISVVSGLDDNRVALWERDKRHPGGEAFVAGGAPAQVFQTALVLAKLREGELVEATGEMSATERAAASEQAQAEAAADAKQAQIDADAAKKQADAKAAAEAKKPSDAKK